MLRIWAYPNPTFDARVYCLADTWNPCRVCGSVRMTWVVVPHLESLIDPTLRKMILEARWRLARRTLANLPPCDHGAVARARRRHRRRHPETTW